MICNVCREAAALAEKDDYELPLEDLKALHKDCKGGTHCDCQHKPTRIVASDGSRAQRRY